MDSPLERHLAIPDCPDLDMPDDVVTGTNDQGREATCFALMGMNGGVGVTSLAIQLAYELSKVERAVHGGGFSGSQSKTCLIDLDFETGSVLDYLDIEPVFGTADLQDAAERFDETFLRAVSATHGSGFSVIACRPELGANDRIDPVAILSLLDMACRVYDNVVIDMPRFWRNWTQAVLSEADHIALLSEVTVPGLHAAKRRLEELENMSLAGERLGVVLTKVERRAFRNAISMKEAEAALGRSVLGAICPDVELTRDALNRGEPCGVLKADARYVRDARSLLRSWQAASALQM